MRLNKLLIPLAFSMLFSSGVVVAAVSPEQWLAGFPNQPYSEPWKCYQLAHSFKELNARMAVKLCSGTTAHETTIGCFTRASIDAGNWSVTLPTDLAVNLCKNNSEPF